MRAALLVGFLAGCLSGCDFASPAVALAVGAECGAGAQDLASSPDLTAPPDLSMPPDLTAPADLTPACLPQCSGKTCGDDGCGGTCGTCAANSICASGACACVPSCGPLCGSDGCGGSCGVHGTLDRVRIMPLGDSLTNNTVAGHYGTYRLPMWQQAAAAGEHIDFVGNSDDYVVHGAFPPGVSETPFPSYDHDNNGYNGWTCCSTPSSTAYGRLDAYAAQWVAAEQPDIIIYEGGFNDLHNAVPVPTLIAATTAMINAMLSVGPGWMQIGIVALPPNIYYGTKVDQLNAGMASLVATNPTRLFTVDWHTGITAADLYDGTHPSPTAYSTKIAPTTLATVRARW